MSGNCSTKRAASWPDGTPKTPEDLRHDNCVVGRFGPEWTFRRPDGRRFAVRVQGNTVINSGDALREAAVWLMDGTSVISGANVGFNPGSSWQVIPQDHDLLV